MYLISCVVLTGICAAIEYYNRKPKLCATATTPNPPGFVWLRDNYILVYCLMMAGDWLQGPYVYALYDSYGFSVSQIGEFFIAGFGSSLVVGTLVGSLADRFGRKKACLLYCVIYVLSCVTKHWNNFHILMVGRVLGGIATSLLFSAFESWVVAEHFSRNFDGELLGDIFSRAVFFGNGLVAIISGVVANYLVRDMDYGPLIPFDLAIVVLIIGGFIISATWNENYGTRNITNLTPPNANLNNNLNNWLSYTSTQFKNGFKAIQTDHRVFYLGCMQGLFEASMYTFVFLWTPTMAKYTTDVPHGFIFANFMLSCMVGSALAGYLMGKGGYHPESYMRWVFALGAGFLAIPGVVFLVEPHHSYASVVCYVSFCLFEIVVGLFWPSMMKMRSKYVPEEVRSTVINIFRMPLNLFVCVMLFNVSGENMGMMFFMCSVFLASVCLCQVALHSMGSSTPENWVYKNKEPPIQK